MEWTLPGWRDMILLAVALATIYLVVTLLRLTRVGRRDKTRDELPEIVAPGLENIDVPARKTRQGEAREASSSFLSGAAYEEATGPSGPFTVPPTPTFEWNDVRALFGEEADPPPPKAKPAPVAQTTQEARRGGFGEAWSEHLAKAEVESEMERMRVEMERMRIEMEELRAARRVSPQYAEAMELSQRGLTAQDVADRMGISLAEAELVHALSRGRQVFEEGEEHGTDGNPTGFDEFDRR